MAERLHDNTKSTHYSIAMWAPSPWSHITGNECNAVAKCIAIVLGHFVIQTGIWVTSKQKIMLRLFDYAIQSAD